MSSRAQQQTSLQPIWTLVFLYECWVHENGLKQLSAPETIGEGQVPLGGLQAVYELLWPFAIVVAVSGDPADCFEKLCPELAILLPDLFLQHQSVLAPQVMALRSWLLFI